VGPACQRQCRAVPSPDWLLWAAVSERAGWLKSHSDSTVRIAAVRTHARAPDRAAARARLAPRVVSQPPSAVPTAPRPDHRCPTPHARPVRSRRVSAVDAAVYSAAPVSASPPGYLAPSTALTLSPVTAAHRRSSPSHRADEVHARRATRRRCLRRRAALSSTLRPSDTRISWKGFNLY
jgi:hypothetical protein